MHNPQIYPDTLCTVSMVNVHCKHDHANAPISGYSVMAIFYISFKPGAIEMAKTCSMKKGLLEAVPGDWQQGPEEGGKPDKPRKMQCVIASYPAPPSFYILVKHLDFDFLGCEAPENRGD